jgi:hypothetical protein
MEGNSETELDSRQIERLDAEQGESSLRLFGHSRVCAPLDRGAQTAVIALAR